MKTLEKLQQWYLSNCNGDWEHSCGVEIGTLDNPGWQVKISLAGTALESKSFVEVDHRHAQDPYLWYRCWREENVWHAAGGPEQLVPILEIFLDWVRGGDTI